ncbi:uncharacterized protein LOC112528935 isoform X2 [Cynara cardunculus var. scolymus]|uniref:uncharacterized protein LOC112528935 isoform X2 n=1 Tax=Cynara cardunculus var. scolymus TaxID=59895 RepID=UPI000D627EE2|nr:uncharacterized protein LOC112528935 isoform X2 [Cynara cardunculus var. scolymus]
MGDDDNGNDKSSETDASTWDFDGQETQIFDSQFFDSPTSSPGNKFNGDDADEFHTLHGTIPFDDIVMFEDELATQVMDPDGETQLVNLGCETQVVNFDAEIEVMDFPDFVEQNGTQLFNDYDTEEVVDSDHEGTENTQVVDESDELSVEDSGRRASTNSADLEHTQHMRQCNKDTNECKPKMDCGRSEQQTSGVGFKTFTSIRAASMRASGLAALNKASQRSKSPSCSTLCSEPDIEHRRKLLGRSPSHDLENHKLFDGPETGNRCRFGRATARKLFAEDAQTETKEPNDNAKLCVEANSHMCSGLETELAGLSYVDSQEPGEASQANALDFVDNFLKVNIECSDERDIGKSTGGKENPVLSAKGTQTLAKSANLINAVGERGIFDWDNNREDEGGGEFFRKKKEAFFASGGRKLNSSSSRNGRILGVSRDKKQPNIHEKIMGLVCSDSKLVVGNNKANDKSDNSLRTHLKDSNSRKNLINELDKQSNLHEHGMSDMPTDMHAQETTEIRFDTQMAAEAMEDLCFGLLVTGHESTKADEGCNHMPKGFYKGEAQEKSLTKRSRKALPLPDDGARTRQSKLKRINGQSKEATAAPLQHSAKVRKQHDTVPVKELKRVKSAGKKKIACNQSENLDNLPKRRGEMSLKRREIDTTDAPVESGDQMSFKKQCIQGALGHVTPVARRTRRSMRVNESEKSKDASSDLTEEINILTGFVPKGKRTCQKLSPARQKVGSQSISRLTRSKVAILSKQGKGSGDNHHGNGQANTLPCYEEARASPRLEGSLRVRNEPIPSACATPVSRGTPVKEASPICMGDEYLKQSCRKSRIRSSLIQEVCSLASAGATLISPTKDTRKRRDVSLICVLFSRHLDGDIVKQQKKILSRLGASESFSMSDATHFIADDFVRTRNMLEAIALGKPVVTHLWLESCGQACCHIDEKNFILRDAKKEKEFGFSLPASLARACQNPLLKGHKVLITPNTKPGKDILANLVKAVHGVAVERMGRTALKDDKVPERLLILSCEEDYALCLPFLEKGAAIYSSELILNGIVTQRLDYQRHRLFLDHVKRTRSTVWLKKDDNQYKPVGKGK